LGGIRGDVIDIGVLRTTIMESGEWVKGDNYNGRIVRVSNSFVFKEPVFNYSADFPFLWDEITVPVKHGSDPQATKEIMLRIMRDVVGDYISYAQKNWEDMVEKYRIEAASVEPSVTLSVNENWLEFTMRYVVDYKLRRSTKDKIFTCLLDEFNKTDGRVALASPWIFRWLRRPRWVYVSTNRA
jgi:small-conductance mechanosensitive channel